MKKNFLPLAICALCSSSAFADGNVSVYGLVDMGLVHESGGKDGAVTKLTSGVMSGSRLGFKGKEDLGNGLAANFVIENGFNADTGAAGQGGLLFGRQAFVGLSGSFGALTLGRQYSPYYKTVRDISDPFGAVSLAGRAGNLIATNTRVDNMVEYQSPSFANVRADLAYGAGEVAGDSARNRTLSASVGYAAGKARLQFATFRLTNPTATDSVRNNVLAGSYDFGPLAANAGYASNKGLGIADSRDLVLGISARLGVGKVLLSHVRHDDRSAADRDATQWGVGYLYSLSKRTDFYGSYATIHNRNGANFTVGNATEKGTGNKALDLGVRHSF